MSPQAVEAIGLVAALLTTSGFLPQVYKTWRSRDVRGLSVWMYLVLFLGTTLWLAYGLLTDSLPLILANLIASSLTGLMLIFILLYRHRR
mgnify:CR=1 FL=1|jgi:MtN3 and saliva related transmembrane protein